MTATIRLTGDEIRSQLTGLLARQFTAQQAATLADIFADAELDGVHTHGLKRLPRFLQELAQGDIKPDAQITRNATLGAWEVWDGGAGPGPLNALAATRRAVELAQGQGIGCVSLHNTNHWLRPGYYGKQAAAQGCALLCWTNTLPNVVPHGGRQASIGNNPLTIAIPAEPVPFILDMAVSQFSYGKLQSYEERGEILPVEGGYDEQGNGTRDPAVIRQRMSASAIGLWKGTGLSMALDLLAALLSTGQSTCEIGRRPGEQNISQVFIALDLKGLYGEQKWLERSAELLEQLRHSNPDIHWPGEGIAARRDRHKAEGVDVDTELWHWICAG
jgi:3-dehydro-L-gulonate 2-dehydrogenase